MSAIMNTSLAHPYQVQIMVTERCNLRCKHCAVPEEDSPADHELDWSEWRSFIRVLAKNDIRDLAISGGEAFLRSDLIELALYAHEQGIEQTTITTNMTLVTPAIASAIAEAQRKYPNFGIQVSIDGASSKTHDWMRGRGNFKVLLRNINRLLEHGGAITGVNSVMHRNNFSELEALVKLTHDIGAKNLRLFPIGDIGRGINIQDYILSPAQWWIIFDALPSLRRFYGLDIMCVGPILNQDDRREGDLVPNPNAEVTSRYCVGPDGDLFVCPPLRTHSLGNVTVLEEESNWHKAMQMGSKLTHETCSTCQFLLLCVGVNPDQPLRPAPNPYLITHPQNRISN